MRVELPKPGVTWKPEQISAYRATDRCKARRGWFHETRDAFREALKLTKTPGERAFFCFGVGLLHLLSLLPDFVLRRLGAVGGLLTYLIDRRHVRIGLRNLEIAFPTASEAARKRILRASYLNLGRSAGEYVRLAGFFYHRVVRRVRYENLEYWDEVADRLPGRGAVLLTAHFGNFELLPAVHALNGFQISLVHHTQRFRAGDAIASFVRLRAGIETLRKHSAAASVLRLLREGKFVGIPFDQNAKRREAIFVPFFGEPAATSSGLARLVKLSGAMVVPVFIVREPDLKHHRIVIGREIPVQQSSDPAADLVENTKRFVAAIEDIVRRYPEQFLWIHRRFRTRPRGAPPIYEE